MNVLGRIPLRIKNERPIFVGMTRALPIVLGYVPIGLAFGVLAGQTGLTAGAVIGMSVLVYAGSAQFIAVAMLSGGNGFPAIVATTFLVNLRHFLMSAALAPRLRGFNPGHLIPLAHELTDESFALHCAAFEAGRNPSYAEMAALNIFAQLAWVSSTAAGCLAGGLIPDPAAWGLDFALAAMFIGLLAGYLTSARRVMVAAVAAAAALAGSSVLPGNWNVVTAAVAAATLGMWGGGRDRRI